MSDEITWTDPPVPSGDPEDRAAAEQQADVIGTVVLALAPQLTGDWGTIRTLLSKNPIPPDVLRERVDVMHPKMRSLIHALARQSRRPGSATWQQLDALLRTRHGRTSAES